MRRLIFGLVGGMCIFLLVIACIFFLLMRINPELARSVEDTNKTEFGKISEDWESTIRSWITWIEQR